MKLAEILKQRRESLNLTQEQVAENMNIPIASYKRYEQGRALPLWDRAIDIIRYFKINIEEIENNA